MKKSSKMFIGIIGVFIIAGFVLGVLGFIRGLGESRNDIPPEVADAFQNELTRRGVERGGRPIEGFDAFLLLRAFPGLQEEDFNEVLTGIFQEEGLYSYTEGELRWNRTKYQSITSGQKTVSKDGYRVLLKNLSERLGMPASSVEDTVAIIDAVDIRHSWKTATHEGNGISFQYPETLTAEYIYAVDWPPQVQVLDEQFVCTEAGEETDRADGTRERGVDGRTYCVTTVAEGAAGSIYRQYVYAFSHGDQTIIFTFSLRFPQCGNYDEPRRTDCENEREAFDLDGVVDLMAQSVRSCRMSECY